MIGTEAVEAVILRALANLNEELPDDKQVKVDLSTVLFGVNAELDSLSLVAVVVEIETTVNSDLDLEISLTDDRAMSQEVVPFTTGETLRDYIMSLANELQVASGQ
jgi:acyl carrier protein